MITLNDICENINMVRRNSDPNCISRIISDKKAFEYQVRCFGIDCDTCRELDKDEIAKMITKRSDI